MSNQEQSASDQQRKPTLPVQGDQPTPPPPAFGCIVYLARESGGFRGRVANLAGIEATAPSQRELLGQITSQFKLHVSNSLAAGNQPQWIDPPLAKSNDETKLFLPVHL
ncbi:hypothetical protein NHH03_26775 [Stieleria sp. TO1_6]|uniref:hypothetical protein n=1 Tax=Stieleria tagensis TaxID=2956795 RepID=UPI00209AE06B|nr:hypothetical protein [Stieleria tagensis]MCO8125372.1 hypothetical protein [Stieleria tagensis]